ncbi:hypothetical protein D3C72_1947690 [compost metagenome]
MGCTKRVSFCRDSGAQALNNWHGTLRMSWRAPCSQRMCRSRRGAMSAAAPAGRRIGTPSDTISATPDSDRCTRTKSSKGRGRISTSAPYCSMNICNWRMRTLDNAVSTAPLHHFSPWSENSRATRSWESTRRSDVKTGRCCSADRSRDRADM